MAENSTGCLPFRLVLIAALCIGSLAAHFFLENLGPAGPAAAVETTERGSDIDPVHADGEDAFVLPGFIGQENSSVSDRVAELDSPDLNSQPASPVLPPPKSN